MLSLIVGRARNGAIGKGNDIPWHIPEDLAFFQRETRGGAIIMGRNTWDSLPYKPLKDRLNIVVSSAMPEGEHVVRDIDAALIRAANAGHARIYGIGGAGIYEALLPRADRLLISHVDLEIPDADVFFPEFEPGDWVPGLSIELRSLAPRCVMQEYLRK